MSSLAITQKKLFAKGKRGLIYRGLWNNHHVCLKQPHPKSAAIGNLEHEYHMLQWLYKKKLPVPKPIAFSNEGLFYYYLPGITLKEAIEQKKLTREFFLKLIKRVSRAMKQLDELGITKEEMQHPWKHIILYDPLFTKEQSPHYAYGIYLLDFERAKKTQKPKNLTQWLQFLTSKSMQNVLLAYHILYDPQTLRQFASKYKQQIIKYHQQKKQSLPRKQLQQLWKKIFSYLSMKTFYQKVWKAALTIPPGKVISYQTLAKKVNKPKAARAVALAMKVNPFAPFVPCHRVVQKDGKLGGYNQGQAKKKALLEDEGIVLKGEKIAREFFIA